MLTTVSLDPDVLSMLAESVSRSGSSFNDVLNDAVRSGLAGNSLRAGQFLPPQWPVHDLGLPLVDITKAAALADELDDQASANRLARPQ